MDWRAFLSTLAVLTMFGFVVGAMLSPPDPFSQLLFAGPLFVVAVPLSYWLVSGGYDTLGIDPPSVLFAWAAILVSVVFADLVGGFVLSELGLAFFPRRVIMTALGLSVATWLVFLDGMDVVLGWIDR